MSKNLVIGAKTYNGVSTVNFNTTGGGVAVFKDTDEIVASAYDISEEPIVTHEVAEEVTVGSALNALGNIQLDTLNNIVVIHIDGDNAPTQGQYTPKKVILLCNEGFYNAVSIAFLGAQSLVAPSSIKNGGYRGVGSPSSAYVSTNITSKIVKFNANFETNVYVPAGSTIKVTKIPFDLNTGFVPKAE